ncbi:MAG: ABC transporter ATP-binding protein, partial [Bacteroidaceae bacterium]|nr:ABC transporter ATP-binding protein [Bacteroidaceae bacterium]
WEKLLPNPSSESKENKPQAGNMDNRPKRHEQKRKMTFKEKKEFEQLETEISNLEAEKAEIENALCSGTLSVEKITELSKRLPVIEEELDEKSMRWLELSEIES